jgi:hypothetical protein
VFLKRPTVFFVAGVYPSVLKSEVLQVALAGLVAHGAVEWVIDEQKLHHASAGFKYLFVDGIFDYHAILHLRDARRHELGHGAGVFFGAGCYLYQASSALTTRTFEGLVVAHGRRGNLRANTASRLHDGGTRLNVYRDVVNRYFHVEVLNEKSNVRVLVLRFTNLLSLLNVGFSQKPTLLLPLPEQCKASRWALPFKKKTEI